jgi:nicotinamide-nucleotide adenylyltransferase
LFTGLFIGRFQPFHLGHQETIRYILKQVDDLVIAVGSAQKSHEVRNPFTAGERIQMIRSTLAHDRAVRLEDIIIIPVPDADVHLLWTHLLDSQVPKYDVVFTNDQFTTLLFRDRGIKVIQPPLLDRTVFSATNVRSRIINDLDWKQLVSLQTARVILDINGIQRIKALGQNGSNMAHK